MSDQTPSVVGRRTGPVGRVERVVGWCVLAALVTIAARIGVVQARLNPAVRLPSASAEAVPSTASAGWLAACPTDLAPLGPAEDFNSDSLSDKIDGKAELYLSAGFTDLTTRRFALSTTPAAWFEVFLFEMANPRAAYAVYSAQRRPNAEPLGRKGEGYISGNGVFFLRGRHYGEIISADLAASSAARAFAVALQQRLPAEEAALHESDFFPADVLVADSLGLLADSAFGCDELNQVVTARLRLAGGEVAAFVSLRASPDEAKKLTAAYASFLATNGGLPQTAPASIPGATAVDLFGYRELVFAHGRVVAGVHDAKDAALAGEAAGRLFARIRELDTP